jgi:RNA polymerase sigma-70 factor (ECF subfamily)
MGENDKEFEVFFKKYQSILYRIALGYVRRRETAEDITIDGFLQLFKRWEKVSAMTNPAGYAVRTVINLAKSHMKRAGRVRQVGYDEKRIGTTLDSPEHRFFLKTANAELERELFELEEKGRNLILLKDIDGHTFQEISDITSMKLPTVKSIYRRAKLQLAKKLGNA